MAIISQYHQRIPFLRLLIALVTGIILQDHYQLSIIILVIIFIAVSAFGFSLYFLKQSTQFTLRWLKGLFILVVVMLTGSMITYLYDIKNQSGWIKNFDYETSPVLVTISEPLVVKQNSYKAECKVTSVQIQDSWRPAKANVLVYFKKDSLPASLTYGSKIVFRKRLQPIVNQGNPGQFDYERYLALRNIHFQIYLAPEDYVILSGQDKNFFQQWLFDIRKAVIHILQKNIPGRDEQAVAEALLIGYRDNLDRELVQSFSNTGVVHIISISGLHVGLVYMLLLWMLSFFPAMQRKKALRTAFILLVLWLFALIAGAAPSVLRSALMFSFLVIGAGINRKTNVYNTLASSAFCLLVFNPYFLWDIGFQLSYAAVLSILLFRKPIYNLLYFKNKLVDNVWSLNAVTISAQILTLPLVFYYFHQFPNLFLIANLIVVPLTGFILYAELFLVLVSKLTFLASLSGQITGWLLKFMNEFIKNLDQFSFAVAANIQVSILQAFLLYGVILFLGIWLSQRSFSHFFCASICLLFFLVLRTKDVIQKSNQLKMVVYHVPKVTAIDIFEGKKYRFIGDSMALKNTFIESYYLKASRILHRASLPLPPDLTDKKSCKIESENKNILILHKLPATVSNGERRTVDVIILQKNANIQISQLAVLYDFKELVFDSSNSVWKIDQWKKQCDSLHLRFHSVAKDGAYELDL